MAKTKILTKDGLEIYDTKIKDYIQSQVGETPEGVTYVDPDESTEIEDIEDITSAKLVSYSNADSGINATNVQDAIDVIDNSIDNVNTELVKKVNITDIVDNLESTDTDLPLSANQGRVLKESITKELINKTYNMDTPITISANTIHSFCAVTIPANSYAIVDFSANNRSSGNPTLSIGTATDDLNMTVYNRVTGIEQFSSVETTIFINNMSDTPAIRNIVVKSATNISLQYVGVRGFTAPY